MVSSGAAKRFQMVSSLQTATKSTKCEGKMESDYRQVLTQKATLPEKLAKQLSRRFLARTAGCLRAHRHSSRTCLEPSGDA